MICKLFNPVAIFIFENEVPSLRMDSSKIINDLEQSRRRHFCPHDLNHQTDEDETNINIANKEWNWRQEFAFKILCTFSVVIGIAFIIILIVLKCL